MKHIVKIVTLLVAISALWIGLLQTSVIPSGYALMYIKLCHLDVMACNKPLVDGWSKRHAVPNLSARECPLAAGHYRGQYLPEAKRSVCKLQLDSDFDSQPFKYDRYNLYLRNISLHDHKLSKP